MGLIRRKGSGYVDYTALQKRGLLRLPEIKKTKTAISKDGFIDFSQMAEIGNSSNTNSSTSSSSTANSSISPFGFLDNLAASSSSESTSTNNELSSLVNASSTSEISSLKIKLDDLEYKLGRLIERLEKIEGKI